MMKENKISENEKIKTLFLEYADSLLAYSLSICGNYEEAKDVVSETFLKAIENVEIFNCEFNCKAWLFKVATNGMRNTFTRFLKRFVSFSNNDLDLYSANTNTPEDIILKNEEFIKLSEAIRKLEKIDGEIIYLKYYEYMSYFEIAEILQIPEGTIASKLSRALRRLENELKK